MKHTVRNILLLLMSGAVLVSCASAKSITLLLDMQAEKAYLVPPAPALLIHKEDRLGIQVLSENPQLAAPFNAGLSLVDASAAAQKTVSYTVDSQGEILFPVLGRLKVEGLTLEQVKDLITSRIVEKGYIRNPIVNVTLENFTVSLLGGLGNNVLEVKDPSINLLQVLSRAGDISAASNIKEVTVIRTELNTRKSYVVNLQKTDLFQSPVFYLQQNDIVYVKPRGTGLSSEGQAAMTFLGTGLSLASIITNFLIWIKR